MYNPLVANLYNAHKGQSVIIVCNGPSLNGVSKQMLAENITIGMNKIFMWPFVPNYFVCVNPLVLQQSWGRILDLNTIRFVSENTPDMVRQSDSLMVLHSHSAPVFSYEPSRYIYEGHTVTFVALQLAFFMGFTKVGLVGLDHRYKFEGQPNEKLLMKGNDPNHFSPNYFKDHEWHAPDLPRAEFAYMLAKQAFEADGRKILNLTEGSALEVFRKVKINKWTP